MESITNLKLSVLVFFSLFFFVSGAESYIILPTAWYYIDSLGFSKAFYGAVLAAQSLGFLLFSFVVGKLADKTRKVKLILLVCVGVKIASNVVYAIPASGYCPLFGCFFSGAANAAYGAIYGEIVRHTANENRSKPFILVDSMFMAGATCGPVLGSIITFKANILGWPINDGNSPGLVLAIIWSVLLCGLISLPSDFGTEEKDVYLTGKDDEELDVSLEKNDEDDSLQRNLTSTVLALFYIIFSNNIAACTFSGIVSLLAMELFHWELLHVKLLFATGMMFVIAVDLAMYFASTYYSERSLLAFSVILQLPSLLLLCTYGLVWKNASFFLSYSLICFMCFGMPQACFAFSGSILSKITPSRHASIIQSLAIVDTFVAALVGRGVSGVLFTQTSLLVYSVTLVLLWLISVMWLGFVYHHLAPRKLLQ